MNKARVAEAARGVIQFETFRLNVGIIVSIPPRVSESRGR